MTFAHLETETFTGGVGIAAGTRKARSAMQQSDIIPMLKRSVGQIRTIRFGEYTETVRVISVDPDGFVCRLVTSDRNENTEFWLSFDQVSEITEA